MFYETGYKRLNSLGKRGERKRIWRGAIIKGKTGRRERNCLKVT